MRGHDPDSGEFLSPSRSQQRREALDVLALAHKLGESSAVQCARLPIPDELLPVLAETRRITAHVARKRQVAYLAKQLRKLDDAALDAIRDAMDESGEAARREVARMHAAEDWRERLLAGGDDALADLLSAYPHAERQQLRQLLRNAGEERARGKPPRSHRELYRVLRATLDGDASTDAGDDDGHGDHPA